MLAIDWPGWNTLDGTWSTFPMTIVTAIVSPSARPNASMTPPRMPIRAVGRMTCRIVSHRVAPIPVYPSRRESGTDRMTSRETATTIGTIMTASTMPAVNTEKRVGFAGSSAKNGITFPIVDAIHHWNVSREKIENTYRAQIPMTTLGIAAISSTRKVSTIARRRGAYSTRNTATRTPSGAATTRPMSADSTVPAMNGSAPIWTDTAPVAGST